MPITYPLSWPSTVPVADLRITALPYVATARDPFGGVENVYAHQGQIWRMRVSLPRLSRRQFAAINAFRLKLNGPEGTFTMGDASERTPRGALGGTPLVSGSVAARSLDLPTKGWSTGVTGVLKENDWIQLGSGSTARLHKVLADADSDGSGLATLTLWPRTRVAYTDGAAIVTSNTVGLWMLAEPAMEWDADVATTWGLEIDAIESLYGSSL